MGASLYFLEAIFGDNPNLEGPRGMVLGEAGGWSCSGTSQKSSNSCLALHANIHRVSMRNAEFLGRGEVLRMNICTEAAKMWKILEQTDTVHGEDAAFRGKAPGVQATERRESPDLRSVMMHARSRRELYGTRHSILIGRCRPCAAFSMLENSQSRPSLLSLERRK
jgi:hypothetical protein